jgi:hypothetical protein
VLAAAISLFHIFTRLPYLLIKEIMASNSIVVNGFIQAVATSLLFAIYC